MFGMRCRPLDLDTGDAALVGLSELFTATLKGKSESPFDPIIGALDAWIEHLEPHSTPLPRSSCARWRSQPRSMAPYLHRDWIVALALPRWPLPSVSFPARFSAIFASALGLRPSDIQPFSVSVARCGRLRLDVEV
jgi:hypothetical protein